MSVITRIIPLCALALIASACVDTAAREDEQAGAARRGGPPAARTGGALDAELADLPIAYTECGGTPDDSESVFIDDTSSGVAYSAAWKAETPGSGLFQGTQHITNIGGYKASRTFSANGWGPSTFSYGYRKMRNAGKAAIYWDGQYFSTISLYAPDNEYRCEFTFYDMPAGAHTVMVKVLSQKEPASGGTYVNLDYFRQYDF